MTTATTKTTSAKTARKRTVKKKAVAKRRSSQARAIPKPQSEPRAQARGPCSATGSSATGKPSGDDAASPRDTYRLRMRLVGDLLHASVGELAEANTQTDRLGRGAYLHILGQVFEALDGLSQAIALDDLVKLSKVVAEQRRAELNSRKVELAGRALSAGEAGSGSTVASEACTAESEASFDSRTLPANFGEVVRRIYGASFADDVEETQEADAS